MDGDKLGKTNKKFIKNVFFIAFSILLNLGGHFLSDTFNLPVLLDIIGTCVAAYFTNVLGAVISAISVGFVFEFPNETMYIYMLAYAAIAIVLRLFVKLGYMHNMTSAMLSSFAICILSIAIRIPLDVVIYDGYTGNIWGDAMYDMLEFKGVEGRRCTSAAVTMIEVIDKQLSIIISMLIIKRMEKQVHRHENKSDNNSAKALVMVGILLAGMFGSVPAELEAKDYSVHFSDYIRTIYDNTNGLPSSSANVIEQTDDGYIWIGGYSGLCRYDGQKFEYITEGMVANVTAMHADKEGRLWIGTNDMGVAIYENGEYTFIDKNSGLDSNSVKTLFESSDGHIYVGTSGKSCRIKKDYTTEILNFNDESVLCFSENARGELAYVDADGNFTIFKDDRIISRITLDEQHEKFTCLNTFNNEFWVGTTSNYIVRYRYDNNNLQEIGKVNLGELVNASWIESDNKGDFWVCTYNGIGYLNHKDELTEIQYPGFDNAVEDFMQDYEGNYWFASSSYGVMKLCKSSFSDIYSYMGLEKKVVNAIEERNGFLYCGTDTGLDIIDMNKQCKVENKLTDKIGSHRVRYIMKDSRNRLWICCYGKGLICYQDEDNIEMYTKEDNGTAGNYFRCLIEAEDGTIIAGGKEGLTFVKDGRVIHKITGADGLDVTQILTLTLDENGIIYAGSDGSGIYVIDNGKFVDTISVESGLTSPIILRITPYKNGYFIITSNALNYMENGVARRISKFPYFNNFDILIKDETAWVLSSCGIFATDVNELVKNDGKKLNYSLYDYSNGLQGSITANSWTYIDAHDNLYFCSNVGAEKISMAENKEYKGNYKMCISRFAADGKNMQPVNNQYVLDEEIDEITVEASVFNYNLEDLKVRFYISGLEENPVTLRQSELSTITYRNIPNGKYELNLQILDNDEKVIQQQKFTVIKEQRMWETGYFKLYMMIFFIWVSVYVIWVVLTLEKSFKRKKELELESSELESTVTEQTRKITAMQWDMIEGMASLIESRDGNTGEHIRNTAVYVKMIAQKMYEDGFYTHIITQDYVNSIAMVAPLHDIGKVKISDTILNKPGKFTPEEFEIMKTHAAIGGQIVQGVMGAEADPYLIKLAQDIATYHHERWNGSGYPYGKSENEIPLCARIMAVADVFDALVSKRVYKDGMSVDDAYQEIINGSGTQFQPEIVDVFIELRPQVEEYLNNYAKDKAKE